MNAGNLPSGWMRKRGAVNLIQTLIVDEPQRRGQLKLETAIEIIKRSDTPDFVVLPRRWMVERTIA